MLLSPHNRGAVRAAPVRGAALGAPARIKGAPANATIVRSGKTAAAGGGGGRRRAVAGGSGATTAAVRAASRICPRARRVRTAAASGCLNAAATAETTPSTATEKTSHTPTGTAGAVVAAESAAVEGYPAQAVRFRRR